MVDRQFRPKQKNKSNIVKICTKFLCVVGWVVIWAGMEKAPCVGALSTYNGPKVLVRFACRFYYRWGLVLWYVIMVGCFWRFYGFA